MDIHVFAHETNKLANSDYLGVMLAAAISSFNGIRSAIIVDGIFDDDGGDYGKELTTRLAAKLNYHQIFVVNKPFKPKESDRPGEHTATELVRKYIDELEAKGEPYVIIFNEAFIKREAQLKSFDRTKAMLVGESIGKVCTNMLETAHLLKLIYAEIAQRESSLGTCYVSTVDCRASTSLTYLCKTYTFVKFVSSNLGVNVFGIGDARGALEYRVVRSRSEEVTIDHLKKIGESIASLDKLVKNTRDDAHSAHNSIACARKMYIDYWESRVAMVLS